MRKCKYEVWLKLPTVMWAFVEVEADSESAASEKALDAVRDGEVSFESVGFDNSDAEVTSVEEVE